LKKSYIWFFLILIFTGGCKGNIKKKASIIISDTISNFTIDREREDLLTTYIQIPETADIINAGDLGMAVYNLCQQRYTEQLATLKQRSEAIGAKLILIILTPEVGDAVNISIQNGIPFIMDAARKLGIKAYDISTPLAKYSLKQLTQIPVDGHFSAAGAKIVAGMLQSIIEDNNGYRATKTFPDSIRPATFGDLDPSQNTVLDGGKNLPYHLITNSQGLRMDYDLTFPKSRQRILFLGDSHVYFPFLDNSKIATTLLQQHFTDKDILNAGMLGYTMDDHVSLLIEKAQYVEPDIIIVETNPNDIGDFYFTQRNRIGRSKKAYKPTAVEKSLYRQLYIKHSE